MFESIKNWVLGKINGNWVQMIGAIFLLIGTILAFCPITYIPSVLLFFGEAWLFWMVMIVVGLIDLFCVFFRNKFTISRWIMSLSSSLVVKRIIMFVFLGLIWWRFGPQVTAICLAAFLDDHLFERPK